MGSHMGAKNHFKNVKMYPFIFVKIPKIKLNSLKTFL